MLSKTTLQAIRAVAILARLPENQYAGAHAVANEIDAAQNYLGKMMQTLAKEGILISQKGLNGGFRLARRPEVLTLYDIAEPFEHLSRWNGCFIGNSECTSEHACAVHHKWAPIRDSFLRLLRDTTVADVAGLNLEGR
ncbi:MAG: putative HTH-type transcriptional regulator [Candidatus Hydrogenedentota bacterium]